MENEGLHISAQDQADDPTWWLWIPLLVLFVIYDSNAFSKPVQSSLASISWTSLPFSLLDHVDSFSAHNLQGHTEYSWHLQMGLLSRASINHQRSFTDSAMSTRQPSHANLAGKRKRVEGDGLRRPLAKIQLIRRVVRAKGLQHGSGCTSHVWAVWKRCQFHEGRKEWRSKGLRPNSLIVSWSRISYQETKK